MSAALTTEEEPPKTNDLRDDMESVFYVVYYSGLYYMAVRHPLKDRKAFFEDGKSKKLFFMEDLKPSDEQRFWCPAMNAFIIRSHELIFEYVTERKRPRYKAAMKRKAEKDRPKLEELPFWTHQGLKQVFNDILATTDPAFWANGELGKKDKDSLTGYPQAIFAYPAAHQKSRGSQMSFASKRTFDQSEEVALGSTSLSRVSQGSATRAGESSVSTALTTASGGSGSKRRRISSDDNPFVDRHAPSQSASPASGSSQPAKSSPATKVVKSIVKKMKPKTLKKK